MLLGTVSYDGRDRVVAALDDDRLLDLHQAAEQAGADATCFVDMLALIHAVYSPAVASVSVASAMSCLCATRYTSHVPARKPATAYIVGPMTALRLWVPLNLKVSTMKPIARNRTPRSRIRLALLTGFRSRTPIDKIAA